MKNTPESKQARKLASLEGTAKMLVDALKLQLATHRPFLSKSKGGLGLPYTSENLTHAAYAHRLRVADELAHRALARAKKGGLK